MRRAVEDNVLVNLVGHRHHVVAHAERRDVRELVASLRTQLFNEAEDIEAHRGFVASRGANRGDSTEGTLTYHTAWSDSRSADYVLIVLTSREWRMTCATDAGFTRVASNRALERGVRLRTTTRTRG